MKKILISGILILSFLSCKNDKTTDTPKTDSNGKTVNPTTENNPTEPTTEESGSLFGDLFTEKPTAFVKQDGNDKLKFQFNLEKGKTYPYTLREVEEQKISAQGQTQSMSNESVDELTFKVQDIKDEKYQVLVSFVSKKATIKAQGKTASIDTNAGMPADKNIAQTYKLYKALVGTSFTMDIDKSGTVSNIKGMENVYNKVTSSLKKELKPEEFEALMKGVKATLNPEVFKKQFEAILVKFPKDGVIQGEKWSNKPETSATPINYELTKLDENSADVKISSAITPKKESKTQNGVTFSASMNGSQNGTLSLDAQSGWLKKGSIVTKITESQSATDGKKTEEMSKTVTNSTFIN